MVIAMVQDSASAPAALTKDTASLSSAEDLVAGVTEALRKNDIGNAVTSAKLLCAMSPPDFRLLLLAHHLEQAGSSGLIVTYLAPHAHEFPADGPLQEVLARAHGSLKQREKPAGLEPVAAAKDLAAKVDREAAVLTASQALQVGDVDTAVSSARLLAEMDPPDPRGLLLLAQCFMQTGRHTSLLVPHIAPHIHKFPGDASLQWILSLGYHSLRQRSKAAEHTQIVVNLKPHWGQAQFSLGHHYYEAGFPARAVPFLRKAAELMPNEFDPHHFLSLSLAIGGDFEEALAANKRALAINPAHESARQHGEELKELVKAPPPRTAFNRWPPTAQDFANLPQLIDNYVIKNMPTGGIVLRPKMSVFTQGSCFARNLARSLQRYDLKVTNMPCGEEYNNTFANRAVVDWLTSGVQDERTQLVEDNLGRDTLEGFRAALRDTRLFVYTMGLAAAHFDRKTGAFVMSRSTETNKAALFRRCDFRTSSVQENVENLNYIISSIRSLAPDAAVVLTVSPVPLRVTTEFNSAIVADCISKSTLRVAVHEVLKQKPPHVIYWPAFEMVRWVNGNAGGLFGAEDGSSHHPNLAVVDSIMDAFIKVFGDPELVPR